MISAADIAAIKINLSSDSSDLVIQDNASNRSLLEERDKREGDVGAGGNAFAEDFNNIFLDTKSRIVLARLSLLEISSTFTKIVTVPQRT